jgi:flagellar biosynthesis/type III secretory pathway protein FliH
MEQDDEELKRSSNPFALVVLAAKKSLESRGNEERQFLFKRELVRLMLEKGYSREEILAVFRFLDGVLALTDLEKERIIYNELRSKEVEKVAYITNFERLAIEDGLKQGLEQGLKQGLEQGLEQGLKQGERIGMLQEARELLLDALEEKFGAVPAGVQGNIQKIEDREILRQLHRQVIRASSQEEFLKSL